MLLSLALARVFKCISCNSLTDKQMNYRLGIWTVRRTEIWQNCWFKVVVISVTEAIWRAVTGGVPKLWATILPSISINDLNSGTTSASS